MEQLYLLDHQQGAKFRGKSFDEILIREDSGPMRSTVSIIIVPGAVHQTGTEGRPVPFQERLYPAPWGPHP